MLDILTATKQLYWHHRDPRPFLRRAAYRLRPPGGVIVRDGYRYRLAAQRERVSEAMYVHGSCARNITTLMTATLPFVRSVIDVGANLGCVTIPIACRFTGHILSIEPARATFALLTENLAMNGLARVVTAQVAISDVHGRLQLSHCPSNAGDHRLASAPEEHRDGEPVDVVTLDSLVDARFPAPFLIKIDVQGHELHVLRSAPRLLAQPCIVIAEYWPYGLRLAGVSMRDVEQFLAATGFTCYEVAEDRPGVIQRKELAAIVAPMSADNADDTRDLVLTNLPIAETGLLRFLH
jgi:FkbM family methyltransferase